LKLLNIDDNKEVLVARQAGWQATAFATGLFRIVCEADLAKEPMPVSDVGDGGDEQGDGLALSWKKEMRWRAA
jgi:hypothetical protein